MQKRSGRKSRPLRIAGQPVERGEVYEINLKVSEFYTATAATIPVTVIAGRRSGPVLFVTAAVHGDELNGTEIIRQLICRVAPADIRGTLVLMPVVNRFGFLHHTRYLPDRRDLNRNFPGRTDGNMAQRVAWEVFDQVIRHCNYGIDLHTATADRTNLPHVRGDMSHREVRRLARAFGVEIIINSEGSDGSLRRAAVAAGVPTILFEAGERQKFQEPMIRRGVEGIRNVLVELGMLQGTKVAPSFRIIVKNSEWVRAEKGGILIMYKKVGELVYSGEEIALNTNPFGREFGTIRSPVTGLVIGATTLPLVNPGIPVAHVVKLRKTLPVVERAVRRKALVRAEEKPVMFS
ncbi:MAG: succinylglutamate desuccinylase/aspartoacylase family protein [Nitrospirae bacterium]|nr:succinylglutamate desuccinylase/aspartoacylase family protein [Nitrospirota bacterium]